MNAGYQNMPQYGQPSSQQMYSQPGGGRYAAPMANPAAYVPQHQPISGQVPSYQQPYKGTLAPGTRVKVGNITVTVKRYLSEGGFAHVYLVTTTQPIPMPSSVTGAVGASLAGNAAAERGETVHVLKRMAVPDKTALADVRREVEVQKLLRNQPNIVHFIEASATALPRGGYEIFILMEYCSGGGIISLMNARLNDRLREEEVLKIFGDVCAGVAVMHHLDPPLMHRDLKVENILMAPSTAPGSMPNSRSMTSNLKATFKLCDFGSAAPVLSRRPVKSMDEVKRVEADLNKHTTLQYRSPEMVDVYQRRVIDEKADIWALGVLLYKLCYYTTPFEENGGGPLAILNVQYRIPPQPFYSQKIKALIQSMLKEQSTDRPTIDQVIIDVHKILGTRPPSAAVHYAQQTAAGKIAAPLPTLVGGSKSAAHDYDVMSANNKANGRLTSPNSDLISIGQTKKEREEAEARELELQKQSITPMRRGRPTKSSTNTPETVSKVEAPPKTMNAPSLGTPTPSFSTSRENPNWTVPSSSTAPALGSINAGPTIQGFGDSFTPTKSSINGGDAISPPSLPKRPSSSSIPAQLSGTRRTEKSPSQTPSATDSDKAIDKKLLRASPNAPSPAISPLRHSPALPGFSVGPSPAASPLPPPSSDVESPSTEKTSLTGTKDELTDRFPSIAELDAKYAATSPATSSAFPSSAPSSVPTGSSTRLTNVVVPGLADRASVGAIAGRFEKPIELQPVSSHSKDRPRGASLSKSATFSAFSSTSATLASRAGRSGGVLGRWQQPSSNSVDKDRPVGGLRSSALDLASQNPSNLKGVEPIKTSQDWLSGDDEPESKLKPTAKDHEKRILASRLTGHVASAALPPKPAFNISKPSIGDAEEIEVDELSSDEDNEPEDASARRPQLPPRNPSLASKPSLSGQELARDKPERPRLQAPGKVKAPSWLVDAVDSPTAAERLMSTNSISSLASSTRRDMDMVVSPITDATSAQKLDEAAKQAQDQLEELLRGPSSEGEISNAPPEGAKTEASYASAPSSQLRAPAWDEDEDEEMRALPKPSLLAHRSLSEVERNEKTAQLVDLGSPSPALPERDEIVGIDHRPLVDLLDEEEPPSANVAAPSQQRRFADAATSPEIRGQAWSPSKPDEKDSMDSVVSRVSEISTSGPEQRSDKAGRHPSASRPTINTSTKPSSIAAQRQAQFTSASPSAGLSASSSSSLAEPQIIQPRRPTPVRATKTASASSTSSVLPYAHARGQSTTSSGLKPWEREAALTAAANKSAIIKSSALPAASTAKLNSNNYQHEDERDDNQSRRAEDPEPRSDKSEGEEERFKGVSSLISRWQQNVESNAPGWGRIGLPGALTNDGKAGLGQVLGPKGASEAAGFVKNRVAGVDPK